MTPDDDELEPYRKAHAEAVRHLFDNAELPHAPTRADERCVLAYAILGAAVLAFLALLGLAILIA